MYNLLAKELINVTKYKDLIIDEVIKFYLAQNNIPITEFHTRDLLKLDNQEIRKSLHDILSSFTEINTIESLIDIIEAVIGILSNNITGVVFTPKYISDYMSSLSINLNEDTTAIDPGCGGGIFLVSIAEKIHKKTNKSYVDIIEENLFGIDIVEDYVDATTNVLEILCLLNGENTKELKTNIKVSNSLDYNWEELFNIQHFDLIMGNPPYYNTHDMEKDEITFLKKNFKTTSNGVFNVFYAFIENSVDYLKDTGELIFIVPNNFLTIKSAHELRKFLKKENLINTIVDFGENMVFKPIRTYNCIIYLSNNTHDKLRYFNISKTDNIQYELQNIVEFNTMPINKLDDNRWNLINGVTRRNVEKIESQEIRIKEYIRTGIATLKDEVYYVNKDKYGFYKMINEVRYEINSELVKDIYKVPELKKSDTLEEVKRYIIFPYEIKKDTVDLITEEKMKSEYNDTYQYLLAQKKELDSRDKGKPNPAGWYAYGRTQGLRKFGKKLLFPTFANKPRFIKVDDELSFFSNGYAVFDDIPMNLEIVQRVLNSLVMEYYIKKTSYPIEGGYYCYQKKYIENFSIPKFTDSELKFLEKADNEEIDKFLIEKYDLEF